VPLDAEPAAAPAPNGARAPAAFGSAAVPSTPSPASTVYGSPSTPVLNDGTPIPRQSLGRH